MATTSHLSRKTKSTRIGTEISSKTVTEVIIIVTTRRSLGTEGATKMLGKVNLLTRGNVTNTLDKLQSTRRK